MEAIIITTMVCLTFIFLIIRVTHHGIHIRINHTTDTTMNTNFQDNTFVPIDPVAIPKTEDELKKDAAKFEGFVQTVNTGINKILNGDETDAKSKE